MRKIFSKTLSLLAAAAITFSVSGQELRKANTRTSSDQKVAEAVSEQVVKEGNPCNGMVRTSPSSTFTKVITGSVAPASVGVQPQMNLGRYVNNNLTLWGNLAYTAQEGAKGGLVKVPLNGAPQLLNINGVSPSAYAGFQLGTKYYSYLYQDILGILKTYYLYEIDLSDNNVVKSYNLSAASNLAYVAAVNPKDNSVYGVFPAANSAFSLAKINTTTFKPEAAIATFEVNWNAFAIDSNGQGYAIDYTGNLLKVNLDNGSTTIIGNTGVTPQYLTGGVIDPSDNTFYWSVNSDTTAGLYTVNLTTGAATNLVQYVNDEEVAGLFIPYIAAAGAPAQPQNLAFNVSGGNLSGKISFDAPTTTYGGTASTGALTYKVYANGNEVASGTTSYGAHVETDLTLTTPNTYIFKVRVSNAAGDSPMSAPVTMFVGKDTPTVPVVNAQYDESAQKFNIKWNASTAAHSGYMDKTKLTYTVTRYPDEKQVAVNISDTTFTDPYPAPAALTSIYYNVQAICDGMASAQGTSNIVVLGNIVLPYSNPIATQAEFDQFSVVDANGDGKKWTFNAAATAARMQYNTSMEMDDWMFTAAVSLEAGKAYYVSVDARSHSTTYVERFEMKYGTAASPEAMTGTIVPVTELPSKEFEEFGDYIVPTTTGKYYIGIHGCSDKDKYYLYVNNFKISSAVSGDAPGAVTNVTIENIYGGAPTAKITFNAPSTTFNNAALTSLTKVEVYRDATLIQTFNNPTIGGQLSFNDSPTEAGEYAYKFVGYNATGTGKETVVNAYVGVDYPADITQASMVENGVGNVKITWGAISTDVNGNALPLNEVTYTITSSDQSTIIAENLPQNQTTYEINNIVAPGEQAFAQYLVFAKTSRGYGKGRSAGFLAVGTPYTVPYFESFADGKLSYILGVRTFTGSPSWALATDAKFTDLAAGDNDNGYIYMNATTANAKGGMFTGKINLSNLVAPELSFMTYNVQGTAGEDINLVEVLVSEDGTNWTSIYEKSVYEICGDVEGWSKVKVSLAAYKGKTVQVMIAATVKRYTNTMFDAVKIGESLNYDLTAKSINAPSSVAPGEEFNVDIVVENSGKEAATGYTVDLYLNGEILKTLQGNDLATGTSATMSVAQVMNAMSQQNNVYYAKVNWSKDENQADNTTPEVQVNVTASTLPTPSNVNAALDGTNNVKVTWTAADPNVAATYVTEGFETAEAGNTTGINGWKFYDEDQGAIGSVQNLTLPGVTQGGKLAYSVISAAGLNNATFTAHSGDKFITTMYNANGSQQADWLISPQLSGNAQTISFYARSYSSDYLETMECYYSTTDATYTSFTNKCMNATVVSAGGDNRDYTLYEVSIPAGAKYFAIKCISADKFMLFLDDIRYEIGGGNTHYDLKGYNVYRDGVKINDSVVTSTEFMDTNVADGTHNYYVSAVYAEGESPVAGPATIELNGINAIDGDALAIYSQHNSIVIVNAIGLKVNVADAAGALIHTSMGGSKIIIPVPSGIYVVTAGKEVKKVIVK